MRQEAVLKKSWELHAGIAVPNKYSKTIRNYYHA